MGPCVRDQGLLVEFLDGDLVVFDVDAQRAHQLCGPAVGVWERCDGARSVAEIAAELGVEFDLVAQAVAEFAVEGLLVEESGAIGLVDRRRLLIGAAAVSVPLMVSVGVFPAAAAASAFFPQITGSPFPSGTESSSLAFSPTNDGLLAVANFNRDTSNAGTVSVFTVNAGSPPTVSRLGSPITTGTGTTSVAFSPGGGLLAVSNFASSDVSLFTVTAGSPPTLSPLGSPLTTNIGGPNSVAFSSSGGLLAVASQAGGVEVFTVSADSPPTVAPLTNLTVGTNPESVAFSLVGGLLAVANYSDGTVSVFKQVPGKRPPELDLVGTYTVGTDPFCVAFSPDGGLLAVANRGGGGVTVFTVSASDPPAITPLGGSPLNAGSGPNSVAFSPSGGLLAVASLDGVYVFTVSAGSPPTLSLLAGSPFTAGTAGPEGVAFSPLADGLLAVANSDGSVTVYVNNTGM